MVVVPAPPVFVPGVVHDCGGPSLSGPATAALVVGLLVFIFGGSFAFNALLDWWDRRRARRRASRCQHRGSMGTQCIRPPMHTQYHHYRDASGVYYET